ncbi:MAG: response regulator [Desulfobacterales bacterium]
MRNVLIVDDDSVTRGLLSRVLKPHAEAFQVVTAPDGKEALNVIQSQKIDLVITDLQMPVMDGFELLARISERHPEIPVFIMTAFGDSEIKNRLETFGSTKYFEKPLNIDIITECIYEELNSGAEGTLKGISLSSFLQLIEMEKKTCTLTVTSKGKSGNLYFYKGDLMTAVAGDLENDEAAYELLCWDEIVIEIENTCKKMKKEIKPSLMTILMEGLKIRDEREHKNKEKRAPLRPLKSIQNK